jgi:hypothetical protein
MAAFLILGLCFAAQTASARKETDFSTVQVPLYDQIVNRIKMKVGERLGPGRNTRDRYFIIPFAYQNKDNDPEFSHSFMTVIRVFADGRQPRRTAGVKEGTYKNREFEAFTISWLPHDFLENPNLCVFKGFGARLFPKKNQCPISVGKDFTLPDTLRLAVHAKVAVGMWGPYEIRQDGFQMAVDRLRLLEKGTIKYRADDRLYRKELVAINCFHAMAGLYDLYPNGGLFGTGFKMWGLAGTERVLMEYRDKAHARGILFEGVNPERDLYGFVYAPTDTSSRRVYHPFKNGASAYSR